MKAETVFNVAIYLSDVELKKLHKLITERLNIKTRIRKKSIKKTLITEQEAEEYILRTVFKIKR